MLLKLLAEQESYGYELVSRVHDVGLTGVPDGSIYPALSRLEREGYASSRLVESSSGPARKYYRLSDKGRRVLTEREAAWRSLTSLLEPLLGRPGPAILKEASTS